MCRRGVFQNYDAFVAGVICKTDPENPARRNVYAPIVGVNPGDILATNATIFSQVLDSTPGA